MKVAKKVCMLRVAGGYIRSFELDTREYTLAHDKEEALLFLPGVVQLFLLMFGLEEKDVVKEELDQIDYRLLLNLAELYGSLCTQKGSFNVVTRGEIKSILISKTSYLTVRIGETLDNKDINVLVKVKPTDEQFIRGLALDSRIKITGKASVDLKKPVYDAVLTKLVPKQLTKPEQGVAPQPPVPGTAWNMLRQAATEVLDLLNTPNKPQ